MLIDVLLTLSFMPFVVAGFVSMWMYLELRKERARREREEADFRAQYKQMSDLIDYLLKEAGI